MSSLSLSTVFNVSVVVSPAATPGPSFNQALIVGPSPVIPSQGANSRARQYTSLTQMLTDGFTSTQPEYLAAALYFGQTPAPTYLWIGRQDLTAIATAAVGASGGTGYTVGDILTVVQGGASGGQVRVATVASGVVSTVTVISGSQGTGYAIGTNLATTGGTGTGAQVNVSAIGETALQSVQACRLSSTAWYACMFVGTAVDADHQAIAAYIEAITPASVYFLTTGAAAVLNGSANNLLALLKAANYRRTFSVYSTTQSGAFPSNAYASAAPMGMAMGRNTGAAGSYFDLVFKPIAGVGTENLTQTQATAICGASDRSSTGLNGNCVLSFANGAYSWLQFAVMSGGAFFDQILNLDMLASDMQISAVNLLTSVPSLPITNAGVQQLKAVLTGSCNRSQAIGFIAPAGTWLGQSVGSGGGGIATGEALPSGYAIYAAPVSSLSQAQRASRVFPPITVLLIEAESGHSFSVTINVQP